MHSGAYTTPCLESSFRRTPESRPELVLTRNFLSGAIESVNYFWFFLKDAEVRMCESLEGKRRGNIHLTIESSPTATTFENDS